MATDGGGLIAPGGAVFYHHFLDGVQHHPTIKHPSSPDDILRRGELGREVFPGWPVIVDDEATPLPDGRPMATFIAQNNPNAGQQQQQQEEEQQQQQQHYKEAAR